MAQGFCHSLSDPSSVAHTDVHAAFSYSKTDFEVLVRICFCLGNLHCDTVALHAAVKAQGQMHTMHNALSRPGRPIAHATVAAECTEGLFTNPNSSIHQSAQYRTHQVDAVATVTLLCRERIHGAPKLKLILTAGIGSDHIDLHAASEKGITVAECTGKYYLDFSFTVLL